MSLVCQKVDRVACCGQVMRYVVDYHPYPLNLRKAHAALGKFAQRKYAE